jgi:hypothetical protein
MISRSCGVLSTIHHCWYCNDLHWNWFDKYSRFNLEYWEVDRVSSLRWSGPWPYDPNGKSINLMTQNLLG